jgi:hypothetical protein
VEWELSVWDWVWVCDDVWKWEWKWVWGPDSEAGEVYEGRGWAEGEGYEYGREWTGRFLGESKEGENEA